MPGTSGQQVNFRLTQEQADAWEKLRAQLGSGWSLSDIFTGMVAAMSESRAVSASDSADRLKEVQATLTNAVTQMAAIVATEEERRRAAVTAAEARAAELGEQLDAEKKRVADLVAEADSMREELNDLRAKVAKADETKAELERIGREQAVRMTRMADQLERSNKEHAEAIATLTARIAELVEQRKVEPGQKG